MATLSILIFGKRFRFESPVLEIGAKMPPGYEQYSPRELHNGGEYVGLDIKPGEGVVCGCRYYDCRGAKKP